jgi:hypothetical protein
VRGEAVAADLAVDIFPKNGIPSVTITYHLSDEEVDRVIDILRPAPRRT